MQLMIYGSRKPSNVSVTLWETNKHPCKSLQGEVQFVIDFESTKFVDAIFLTNCTLPYSDLQGCLLVSHRLPEDLLLLDSDGDAQDKG